MVSSEVEQSTTWEDCAEHCIDVDWCVEHRRCKRAEDPHARSDTTVPPEVVGNIAPLGWLWQCGACGRKVRDRYGEEGGWDESCMLNAVLVRAMSYEGAPQ